MDCPDLIAGTAALHRGRVSLAPDLAEIAAGFFTEGVLTQTWRTRPRHLMSSRATSRGPLLGAAAADPVRRAHRAAHRPRSAWRRRAALPWTPSAPRLAASPSEGSRRWSGSSSPPRPGASCCRSSGPDFPETGDVPLDGQLHILFRLRDGRITHMHDYRRLEEALAAAESPPPSVQPRETVADLGPAAPERARAVGFVPFLDPAEP